MLNVPYDCGFFLTKSLSTLQAVCQNSNSPYLTSEASSEGESIPSPLNISLENSRRFRALPVYAVLLSLGREGFAQLFANQVRLARRLAAWIDDHPYLELLPSKSEDRLALTHIIVILRAKDQKLNDDLASEINARRTIMVSGTKWEGKPATRIAISTWKVDVERDFRVVTGVLQDVLRGI
jgi:glutamate/tyrosine decarboxylase-like PLP-dependent enzyme